MMNCGVEGCRTELTPGATSGAGRTIRGYCRRHYTRLYRYGEATFVPARRDHPPKTHRAVPIGVILEEWPFLSGYSLEEAARRLSMSAPSLQRALYRARAKGLYDGPVPRLQ